MPGNSPEIVIAIESLFEINEVCIDWRVPILALFHNLPQCENMNPTISSFPKACLFLAHEWVNGCRNSVKNNPIEIFASD